jgi:hypothetical protein
MPTLNLNEATKLYYGNTEAQKLYKGGDLLYPVQIVDPYLANVVLYLKGDGANNSTDIVDNSPTPKTITRFGDTKISTTQSKYGGSSIYFDGSGDYLQSDTITELGFSTGDFTIELWLHPLVSWSDLIGFLGFVGGSGGKGNAIGAFVGALSIWVDAGSVSSFNFNPTTNQWVHIALTRFNGTLRAFRNGVVMATYANWVDDLGLTKQLLIGRYTQQGFTKQFNGYIDSLRITKGIARYTANFNPETDTYLAY